MSKSPRASLPALLLGVAIASLVGACNGCRPTNQKGDGAVTAPHNGPPTVRLYVLSDLAGAIEPCGCQKDMLGGIDHFASLVTKERPSAPNAVTVTAGPLFFMDEALKPERSEQDTWKAEALALTLKEVNLAAFAPGKNDWSPGVDALAKLRSSSGAAMVASNLSGSTAGAVPSLVREIGGVKVAFVGVAVPKSAKGAPEGVNIDDATKSLAESAKKARAEGAKIVVGLASIDRGSAIRAAEGAPDLDVLVIGSPALDGDENDKPQSPRFGGPVLVVQPSNHLTRTSIVDFYVNGTGRFGDGSGLAHAEELTNLTEQIDLLTKKISSWEQDPVISKADLAARKSDLQGLRDKLLKAQTPPPPPSGSFVRYRLVDIRESFGKDPAAKAALSSYYKRVNEHNKKKFEGRRAPAPAKEAAQYVGSDVCKNCHTSAFEVWKKTGHAKAYKTLADDSKEFNLDCVSCHVTGYEKPGGSSVTDVAVLKDVQCEQCHGPGSKHISDPYAVQLDLAKDDATCKACHHPPHTDIFDFKVRVEKIMGPGHGKPGASTNNDPPKGWKPPKLRF